MKHVVTSVVVGFGVAVLAGCPIYSDDSRAHRVCVGSDCYSCPDNYYSNDCRPWSCYDNSECPAGYQCGTDRRCRLTSGNPPGSGGGTSCTKPSDCPPGSNCGADNKCHAGDCSTSGCPSSFVCKLSGGVAECVAVGSGPASSCKKDADCPTPPGSKCLSGSCVAPADQCADATQCQAGYQCVQGACTPSCGPDKPCPTGYACDDAKGVCTGNTSPCTNSSTCTNGTVCVEEHCVDPCGPGGTCPAGLTCLDGGCTPNEKPVFTCATDGVQDACQVGSICLRHSCYIGCDQDAGPDACKQADTFNVCKNVTTSSGTHSVCGSDTNLGTDCDPTASRNCASPLICIDGFCR
ncbi:MAG: hypothetical protein KF819_00240 [Labilithrix sp.]|nr:hypothetical protein [Labilithrix sp.]